jgi:glycosyltransferase involved in cell wall biosynthesis
MSDSGTAASRRPTLSVVMIAYNVEQYIRHAIDSVLAQRVDFDYELVIGEDGSTDRTREIVLEYAANWPDRIRPILRDVNLGMNRNFMETLQQARGRFIALLDSDDYWTSPDKLQRQMDFFGSHPECSICFHNTLVVYEDGGLPTHPFHAEHREHLISRGIPKPISTLADLAAGNFMQTCSVMFRAGLYGELPDWYLEMPTFDWPLHVLNAEHGSIGYIDEVLGAYRVHSAGFWSTRMAHYRRISDVEAMIHGYRLIDRHTRGRYRKTIRDQLLSLNRKGAKIQLEYGRRLSALRYALAALSPQLLAHRTDNRKALWLALRALRPRSQPQPGESLRSESGL